MAKRTIQANYFADDKDVYDLLVGAKKRLTVQKLLEIARGRGIILSVSDRRDDRDRDALIEQLARLPFGWHELNALINATDTAERVERMTSREFSVSIDSRRLNDALNAVRDIRAARGETYQIVSTHSGKSLRVTVGYSELDTNKTRLAQRTKREFTLDFDLTSEAVKVRHQDQPRASEVLDDLVTAIAQQMTAPTQRQIELTGVHDAASRTNFFLELIRGIDGFSLEDVKRVKLSKFRNEVSVGISDEDDDDEDDTRENYTGVSPDEASYITTVKEIALKGDGLLQSREYARITSVHDFFVCAITWTSVEDSPEGVRTEFEAGFADPERGTGFSYALRGVYGRKQDGAHRKTKSTAAFDERGRLHRLLEGAASKAMDNIGKK